MRISRRQILTALVGAIAVLGAIVPSASAGYTGACVKKNLEKQDVQYYMRIPNGRAYGKHNEGFPGKSFYDNLKSCGIKDFTCIYDVKGNAHVDFVLKGRSRGLPNKCDIEKHIARASQQKYKPRCVEGTPETLASEWRKSWKNEL